MKILIMGLSGSGKTFLSKLLQKELSCAWYNADNLREMANDWDFSDEGRKRQSHRMKALADFEKEGEVIGLMMYLGDPPELKEHFFTESRSKCLELKEVAEENSNAYYECAKVNAVIKGKKIVSIIEELEVLE